MLVALLHETFTDLMHRNYGKEKKNQIYLPVKIYNDYS